MFGSFPFSLFLVWFNPRLKKKKKMLIMKIRYEEEELNGEKGRLTCVSDDYPSTNR